MCAGNPRGVSCAIEILSFQNFTKVLKTCSAGRKNFRNAEKGTADFRCSFCIYASKTISRVLYLTVIYLDVPLPIRSSHPGSGRASLRARSSRSHTGVAPDRVYSNGLFPAIECALTALFHPYRQGYALAVSRFLTESVAAADDCNREEGPFVPLHTTPLRFPLGGAFINTGFLPTWRSLGGGISLLHFS